MGKPKMVCLTLCLLLTLTACGGLLQGAGRSDGSFTLYVWDGETAQLYMLRDSSQRQQVLRWVNGLEYEELERYAISDLTTPVYSFLTYGEEGQIVYGIWTNGIWVTRDGACAVEADFSQLIEQFQWEEPVETALSAFPGIAHFATDGTGWNPLCLEPVGDPEPDEGISMIVDSVEGDTVTVSIFNDSGEDWSYGSRYGLQVLLDGQWYEVPIPTGEYEYTWTDIACLVAPGSASQKTCALDSYGGLSDGTYRLVVETCAAALTRASGAWQAV